MGSGITYNKETFNTEPLLNELNEIIKKRLEEMFQEFLFKYRLFEENYNAVLNLPALKYNIGTYKQFNVKKVNSNKKRKTSSKNILIIKKLLEKNKLLQEEINKLKGVNIIDLTTDVDSDDNTNVPVQIKEEHIPVRLEKENIRLNIEEDSIVEDSNDNICSDCECRVILDSDITIVDGKNYCGGCVPESDADEDNESDASLEEEADASLEEEEESVASLEEESDASLEKESDAGFEEDDVDTEASDEESVDESSNDLANNEEQASVEANVVASIEESVDEDEELFEIEIDDKTYCTNNEVNGFIYVLDKDGDVGEKVGYFKDSEPIFYNEEN